MKSGLSRLAAIGVLLILLSCRDSSERATDTPHVHPVIDSLVNMDAPIDVSILDTLSIEEKELLRSKLHSEGRYDCCIEPGCDRCIELYGECRCFEKIKEKDKICSECVSGYKRGLGRIKTLNINELREFDRPSPTDTL